MYKIPVNIGDSLFRLPLDILNLLRDAGVCAEAMGFEAYAVGGLVRDLFLRRDNLDVDVVIEGDGIAFASRFSVGHGTRLLTYEKFGTANIVLPDGFKIDVATARTETYERPAALPLVTPWFHRGRHAQAGLFHQHTRGRPESRPVWGFA